MYNLHLAAYDAGGVVKKQQMEWLRTQLLADYSAGRYVVAGGDWNQVPPGVDYARFSPERRNEFSEIAIDFDYAPPGWYWAYDPTLPTNRKANETYDAKKSKQTLIDFFLISPNLRIRKVKGIAQDFFSSDHQPVWLELELLRP
ncbi:MAG: hypothetical protein HC821_03495 [Lewinella sp.]|nr:hypothetical protein [Lewinella sp.]